MKISILYYHKKLIFLPRTVCALSLVLKARVFGSRKKRIGSLVSDVSEARGGGRERRENLLSPSPLEKPDTQTSLLKCHILQLIFSIK